MSNAVEDEIIKVLDPKTGEEVPTDQLAIRLTKKEQARYAQMLKLAFSKNPYIGKADINRLLIGLLVDTRILDKEDIEFFRGTAEPLAVEFNVPETPQPPKEAKKENVAATKRSTKQKERRS